MYAGFSFFLHISGRRGFEWHEDCVKVCLKTGEKNAATKFEVQVAGQDTVKMVSEKVAAAQLIAYAGCVVLRGY